MDKTFKTNHAVIRTQSAFGGPAIYVPNHKPHLQEWCAPLHPVRQNSAQDSSILWLHQFTLQLTSALGKSEFLAKWTITSEYSRAKKLMTWRESEPFRKNKTQHFLFWDAETPYFWTEIPGDCFFE